ncbi:MAG: hypothetical protein GYB64_10795 [Chloroflexi bacterium]|nr:hypothetical protein [Chloroflexota bacterium]
MDKFDRTIAGAAAVLVALIAVVVLLGDNVGAPISAVTPADGSQPGVTTPVRITFEQQMARDTVEERFAIAPEVPGTISWEGMTLVFQPDEPLSVGTTYTATLAAGAQATTGRQAKAISVSFTPGEPSILYLGPADVQVQALWTIPVEGGDPVEVYRTEYGIANFDPSPIGTQVAITVRNADESADIWVINADGSSPRQLTDCSPGICERPAWSADGRQIAYERRSQTESGGIGQSRIWFYDLLTGDNQPVFEDNQIVGYTPDWSPDGSKLTFFDSNQQAIRVVDLEDGARSYLIPSDMGEIGTFSPDGQQMVYTDIRLVGRQFFVELNTTEFTLDADLERLFEEAHEDQYPAWSPDGNLLAFGRRWIDGRYGRASQLMLYDFESGDLREVTQDADLNSLLFEWDPTGRYVMFRRIAYTDPYPLPAIWLYDMQTEQLTRLVESALHAGWLP